MSLSFSWSSLSFCPGPTGPAGPDGSSYEVTTREQVDTSLTQVILLENLGAGKYNITHVSGYQFFVPSGQLMRPEEDGTYIFQSKRPSAPLQTYINTSLGSSLTAAGGFFGFFPIALYDVGTTAHVTMQSTDATVEFPIVTPADLRSITIAIKPLLTFSSV